MSTEFTLPKGIRNLVKIIGFISALPVTKAWRLEVTEDRDSRSLQQCRYLNGVAYKLLSDATGYERDDISEFMCGTFWGWKEKRVPKTPLNPAGIINVPLRTTTKNENGKRSVISTLEFMDFVAFVQRFAADKGIFIPDPDPLYFMERDRAA